MSEPLPPPPPVPASESTRARRRITVRGVLVVLLLALAVVFTVENQEKAKVRLVGPKVEAPLWLVIGAAVVVGILIGTLAAFRRRHRHN